MPKEYPMEAEQAIRKAEEYDNVELGYVKLGSGVSLSCIVATTDEAAETLETEEHYTGSEVSSDTEYPVDPDTAREKDQPEKAFEAALGA